jgi:hypothetical protein
MAPDTDSRRFRLSEIDEILRLARNKHQRSDTVHIRMREKLIEIDDKIARPEAMRERLIPALHAGPDSLSDYTCPSLLRSLKSSNLGQVSTSVCLDASDRNKRSQHTATSVEIPRD